MRADDAPPQLMKSPINVTVDRTMDITKGSKELNHDDTLLMTTIV